MLKSIQFKPTPKEKSTNDIFRAGILKPKMNFTDTNRVSFLDDAEWTVPCIWESEAAEVFWQVYPVTGQIKYKIVQEIDK